MELTSRRLPLMIIAVLLAILIVQFVSVDREDEKFIDPHTCEIYTMDSQASPREYLGTFDPKCMEIKEQLES